MMAKAKAEYQRRWRRANLDRFAKWQRDYRSRHPEKVRAQLNAWRLKNPESYNAIIARWRDTHRAEWQAYSARWRRENAAARREHDLKRRAAKQKATIRDRKKIAAWIKSWHRKPKVRCHWCRKYLPGRKCQVDHVIPLSKGGRHTLNNLVKSCGDCNMRKGAKLIVRVKGE